jgi:hypothetical protein
MKQFIIFVVIQFFTVSLYAQDDFTKSLNKIVKEMQKKNNQFVKSGMGENYVKTVVIEAELFHFVGNYLDGYLKDANRKVKVYMDIYKDKGYVYVKEGYKNIDDYGVVRYSKLRGYEYEANIGNDTFAFNHCWD